MAIDTEDKRRSVSGYTETVLYPVPAGTIDAPDRAQAQWLYSGLSYAPPPPPPVPPVSDGDAAALYTFSSGNPRRLYWRDLADPWARIRAWAGSKLPPDAAPLHPAPTRAKQDSDMVTVTRISRIARRRKR